MSRLSGVERRKRILRTAIAVFSESGFNGVTTRDLARRAGVSEALLFRHFPTKRKLYQAILAARMEEQIPLLLQGIPLAGEPRRTLHELSLNIVEQNERDPSFLRLLLFSALEGHELSELFFQKRNLPLLDFLKKYFVRQTRAKVLSVRNPEVAARAFLGLVFSFVQTRLLFRIPGVLQRPKEETLRGYVEIFLRGLERQKR